MPPSCSTEAARWMCRGCGCRGSIGWMGARLDTRPMLCWRAHHGKNSAKNSDPRSTRRRVPQGEARLRRRTPGSACTAQNVGTNRTFGAERLVFVAPASLQVTHLVQAAFLFRGGFAGHPLPLLDQLADLLSALVTDLGIELRTTGGPDRLAALLADLLVELVPALRLDGLAALAADLFIERAAALLGHLHSALAARLGNRHSALLVVLRHFTASGGWKEPPSRPPLAPSVFKKRITGCASCPARSARGRAVRPSCRSPRRPSFLVLPSPPRRPSCRSAPRRRCPALP